MFSSSRGRINRSDAKKYIEYLERTAKNGKLEKGQEAYFQHSGQQSQWMGAGLSSLNINLTSNDKTIESRQLSNLINGYEPEAVYDKKTKKWTKVPVLRGAGEQGNLGFIELTLSVPKSVSLLWANADDELKEKLEQLLSETSKAYVQVLEEAESLRRSVKDDSGKIIATVNERPAGLIAKSFRHNSSRPVDGYPDPQLHDHIVITGLAPRREGCYSAGEGNFAKYGTIEPMALLAKQAEAAARSGVVMIEGLRDLGFNIVRRRTAWEIEGISDKHIMDASNRTRIIDRAIAEEEKAKGRQLTAQEKDDITLRTREGKDTDLDLEILDAIWKAKYGGKDFVKNAKKPSVKTSKKTLQEKYQEILQKSVVALGEKKPSWKHGELRLQIAIESEMLLSLDECKYLLDIIDRASPERLKEMMPELIVKSQGKNRYTSTLVVKKEMGVLNAIRTLQSNTDMTTYNEAEVKELLRNTFDFNLSEEQLKAVLSNLNHPVSLLEAPAGTGKGVVAKAVTSVAHQKQRKVYALAMSGVRAEKFGLEIEADKYFTIEAFEKAIQNGTTKLQDGDVLLVDEVSQLETLRWEKITKSIRQKKVQLGLFGDRKQLDAIGVGGLLNRIAQELPQEAISSLTQNFRNGNDDKFWNMLRNGEVEEVINAYNNKGLVTIDKNPEDVVTTLLADWLKDHNRYPNESQLIVTNKSNYFIDDINAQLSAYLHPQSPSISYYKKDKNNPDYTRRESLRIGDPVVASERINRTRPLNNGKRINILNGAEGKIVNIDDKGIVTVEWQKGNITLIDQKQSHLLRLAYCRHVANAQGATVERVYDYLGGWQSDIKTTYVAVSRSRKTSHIYSDEESLGLITEKKNEKIDVQKALTQALGKTRIQVAGVDDWLPLVPKNREVNPPTAVPTQAL